ncbi:hypothetical protein MMC34_001494 [Xylographa carneopallida]|nr:hypothetical protein [Xylographa carneopallida]
MCHDHYNLHACTHPSFDHRLECYWPGSFHCRLSEPQYHPARGLCHDCALYRTAQHCGSLTGFRTASSPEASRYYPPQERCVQERYRDAGSYARDEARR